MLPLDPFSCVLLLSGGKAALAQACNDSHSSESDFCMP